MRNSTKLLTIISDKKQTDSIFEIKRNELVIKDIKNPRISKLKEKFYIDKSQKEEQQTQIFDENIKAMCQSNIEQIKDPTDNIHQNSLVVVQGPTSTAKHHFLNGSQLFQGIIQDSFLHLKSQIDLISDANYSQFILASAIIYDIDSTIDIAQNYLIETANPDEDVQLIEVRSSQTFKSPGKKFKYQMSIDHPSFQELISHYDTKCILINEVDEFTSFLNYYKEITNEYKESIKYLTIHLCRMKNNQESKFQEVIEDHEVSFNSLTFIEMVDTEHLYQSDDNIVNIKLAMSNLYTTMATLDSPTLEDDDVPQANHQFTKILKPSMHNCQFQIQTCLNDDPDCSSLAADACRYNNQIRDSIEKALSQNLLNQNSKGQEFLSPSSSKQDMPHSIEDEKRKIEQNVKEKFQKQLDIKDQENHHTLLILNKIMDFGEPVDLKEMVANQLAAKPNKYQDILKKRKQAMEDIVQYQTKCDELTNEVKNEKLKNEKLYRDKEAMAIEEAHNKTLLRSQIHKLNEQLKQANINHDKEVALLKKQMNEDMAAIIENSSNTVNKSAIMSSAYSGLKDQIKKQFDTETKEINAIRTLTEKEQESKVKSMRSNFEQNQIIQTDKLRIEQETKILKTQEQIKALEKEVYNMKNTNHQANQELVSFQTLIKNIMNNAGNKLAINTEISQKIKPDLMPRLYSALQSKKIEMKIVPPSNKFSRTPSTRPKVDRLSSSMTSTPMHSLTHIHAPKPSLPGLNLHTKQRNTQKSNVSLISNESTSSLLIKRNASKKEVFAAELPQFELDKQNNQDKQELIREVQMLRSRSERDQREAENLMNVLADKELRLNQFKNDLLQSEDYRKIRDELEVCKNFISSTRKRGLKLF